MISLIHELESVIASNRLEPHARAIAENAETVVFPADIVRQNFEKVAPVEKPEVIVRPQGSYKRNRFRREIGETSLKARLRGQLNLPEKARIVLGVGYADARKGFDMFLELAERSADDPETVYVWLGHHDIRMMTELGARVDRMRARGKLLLVGRNPDTDPYYAAADAFLMISREDPYPSTVLEALDVGLPVVGFEGLTGTSRLIAESGGRLVAPYDLDVLLRAMGDIFAVDDPKARLERARAFWQRPETAFQAYVHDLLDLVGRGPKRVSAVVPNYNYARFLRERIRSILSQTHPVGELILLDDASTDDSIAVMEDLLAEIEIPVRLIVAQENSGSVFRQWLKGAEIARHDYLWIAEADDSSEPDFLTEVMRPFAQDHVVLSYTQSMQMAQDGSILAKDYLAYVRDVSPTQWTASYVRGGQDEIAHGLSVKNTIPNVSGVVFRRDALVATMQARLEEITSLRVAGDWCTYVHLLKRGSCAFCAKPLNKHRRHSESVTISRFGWSELEEIKEMQRVTNELFDQANYKQKAQAYIEYLRNEFNI